MVRRKLVVAVAFALCITAPIATPASFSDYEQVSGSTGEDASRYKEFTVSCPPGKTAISGGAAVFWNSLPAPKLISSFQIGQSWYGEAEGGRGQVWKLFVQVNCAVIVN